MGRNPKGIPVLPAALALSVLLFPVSTVAALDLSGRTDTGYRFDFGDNTGVHRAYNTQALDAVFLPGLTFSYYGSLLGTFGDRYNSSDADGVREASDNGLRGLLDAFHAPDGSWAEYDLYTAQLAYATPVWGGALGRTSGGGQAVAPYDGVSAWYEPLPWLRCEAFGGMPWVNADVSKWSDLGSRIQAGEWEAGAQVTGTFLGDTLTVDLGYTGLSEASYDTGTLGSQTSVVLTGFGTAGLGWTPDQKLGTGARVSFVDTKPLDLDAWVNGTYEFLAYRVSAEVQPLDASAVADSFDTFAALLGATRAYASGSCDLTADLGAVVPQGTWVRTAQVEADFDYRQPFADPGVGNPRYLQVRAGPLVGFDGGFSVSLYDNFLYSLNSSDGSNNFGGELRERIKAFDFRLGTTFEASSYQANDAVDTVLETFNTQEYYLKVKWQVTQAFDLGVNAAYTRSENASTTTTTPADPSVYPGMTTVTTELNDQARNYFRLDVRAGFRF